ncbi:serine/threonine protein kinase [Kineococcus sp. LSe6-4]|uniref:Serine/threonine protein kinase n=1 Tax=Kineococcus halophytocola TaxID=3234027 RepID=A0ABV4GZS8_9ACTN
MDGRLRAGTAAAVAALPALPALVLRRSRQGRRPDGAASGAASGAARARTRRPAGPDAGAAPGAERPDVRSLRVLHALRVPLVASLVLAVLVPALAALPGHLPGQAVGAVLFATLVPGLPLALALRLPNVLVTAALGVALSFSWALLQGVTALTTGFWHPVGSAWSGSAVAVAATVLVLHRSRPARTRLRALGWPVRPATPWRQRVGGLRAVSVVLLLGAAALWWWGTRVLPLGRVSALGVLPLLGWQVVLAVVVLAVVAVLALRRHRPDHLVLTGVTVLLALVGYTTVAAADGFGSVPTAWVHVGFIEHVSTHGAVPAGVDARFSWPAFWGAGAQLVALAGVPDARSFLALAPLFSALVNLPALLVLGRLVTGSPRWAWAAVLAGMVTNWYQQDYFSPQATALTCYLAVLATCLWLSGVPGSSEPSGTAGAAPSWRDRVAVALRRTPADPTGVSPAASRALLVALVVVVAAIVAAHQLTPLTLLLTLVVFTVTGRARFRALWLLAAVLFAGWFSYGATDFWHGHLAMVLGDVGQVGSSLGAGVAERLTGDPTYQRAQYVRMAWSGLLLLLALAGLSRRRHRPGSLLLAGLALGPFGLLAVQSYGGEVVIRCFLFASPVLAPLAVLALRDLSAPAAVRPRGWGRHRRRGPSPAGSTATATAVAVVPAVALAVVAGLLLVGTRGLNTSFERTAPGLVAASERYFALAGPDDAVATTLEGSGLAPRYPVASANERFLDVDACLSDGFASCFDDDPPEFVLLSSEQEAFGELQQGRPAGWLWRFGDRLTATGYHVAGRWDDALLLQRTP